jgi:hypothetical protein
MFGATGDPTRRKLLPRLFHQAAAGLMPDRLAWHAPSILEPIHLDLGFHIDVQAITSALDPLHGRIAVVTGGVGAIGTAIIRELQGTGHRTVVLDRDADIACDLGSEASTRAAAAAVLERWALRRVFHCAAPFDQGTSGDGRDLDSPAGPGGERRPQRMPPAVGELCHNP